MTQNKPIDEVRFYEYLKDKLKDDMSRMDRPADELEESMLAELEVKIASFENRLNKLKLKAQEYENEYGNTGNN